MSKLVGVYTFAVELTSLATEIAERLQIPIILDCSTVDVDDVVLSVASDGLGFWRPSNNEKPFVVDFNSNEAKRKISPSSQKKSLLLRAIGKKKPLSVLDATAGFGSDAFQLAAFGHRVVMCEESPAVCSVLQDALERLSNKFVGERLSFLEGSSSNIMKRWLTEDRRVDVVYLDPMFPEPQSSALVKKEFQILRSIVDDVEDNLLQIAQQVALKRVVVKRMKRSPFYSQAHPDESVVGKTNRFDIYHT